MLLVITIKYDGQHLIPLQDDTIITTLKANQVAGLKVVDTEQSFLPFMNLVAKNWYIVLNMRSGIELLRSRIKRRCVKLHLLRLNES